MNLGQFVAWSCRSPRSNCRQARHRCLCGDCATASSAIGRTTENSGSLDVCVGALRPLQACLHERQYLGVIAHAIGPRGSRISRHRLQGTDHGRDESAAGSEGNHQYATDLILKGHAGSSTSSTLGAHFRKENACSGRIHIVIRTSLTRRWCS